MLFDMAILNALFTIIVSLFVSLLSVYVSHKISENRETRHAIGLLKLELTTNLGLCDLLLSKFQEDIELNKQGRTIVAPFVLFSNIAWNSVTGTLVTQFFEESQKISSLYVLISYVNRIIEQLNSMKPGSVASAISNISTIRIQILNGVSSFIRDTLKPNIQEVLQLVIALEKRIDC